MRKAQSPIGRVKCVVDSCEFYESGNYCMADTIEIHPPQADSAQETDCATFKHKKDL